MFVKLILEHGNALSHSLEVPRFTTRKNGFLEQFQLNSHWFFTHVLLLVQLVYDVESTESVNPLV